LTTLVVLLLIIIIIFSALTIEFRIHKKRLMKIGIRIHVNGTRGKSSVTRLIAAGLNAGGIKAFAKTTGTLPVVITNKGIEYPLFRPLGANIIEQIRVVAFASLNGAEALVVECMALRPELQSFSELSLIKSTHGVITNVRPDHLEVMGPTEHDVALALLGTTPVNGTLFTAEREYESDFENSCRDRNSKLVITTEKDEEMITEEEMRKFSYIEHKENVALAIKICEDFGIKKEIALGGMINAAPDAGAMNEYQIEYFGKTIAFVNGFAANDPESSKRIWEISLARHKDSIKKIMVLNMRKDRAERSNQLGSSIGCWTKADVYIVIGTGTDFLISRAIGIKESIVDCENLNAAQIFEKILEYSGTSSLVTGIGNIKGEGLELVNYFKNRAL